MLAFFVFRPVPQEFLQTDLAFGNALKLRHGVALHQQFANIVSNRRADCADVGLRLFRGLLGTFELRIFEHDLCQSPFDRLVQNNSKRGEIGNVRMQDQFPRYALSLAMDD